MTRSAIGYGPFWASLQSRFSDGVVYQGVNLGFNHPAFTDRLMNRCKQLGQRRLFNVLFYEQMKILTRQHLTAGRLASGEFFSSSAGNAILMVMATFFQELSSLMNYSMKVAGLPAYLGKILQLLPQRIHQRPQRLLRKIKNDSGGVE